MLQWVVLVLSIFLTGTSLWTVVGGDGGWSGWLGLVCWPIVALASVYNLRTGGTGGKFAKD